MAEVPSTPVEASAPAEPAPQIAANATPPEGTPPATPPQQPDPTAGVEFAKQSWQRAYYEKARIDEEDPPQDIPIEGLPALTNESDRLLFGIPTMRPNEDPGTGINRIRPFSSPIPQSVIDAIPLITRLASRPDAPPEVLQLLAAISRETRGA